MPARKEYPVSINVTEQFRQKEAALVRAVSDANFPGLTVVCLQRVNRLSPGSKDVMVNIRKWNHLLAAACEDGLQFIFQVEIDRDSYASAEYRNGLYNFRLGLHAHPELIAANHGHPGISVVFSFPISLVHLPTNG